MQMRHIRYMVVFLTLMGLLLATPVLASDEHGCEHDATIQSLRDCVIHADAVGHIDNGGVTKSLLAKIDAAQAALDAGQPDVAINHLNAFINAVEAQAGKHIAEPHASHMIGHAQQVIAGLSQ